MTLHYHGADIWPIPAFYEMKGKNLCVCYAYASHMSRAEVIAQSILIDCGAFPIYQAIVREREARKRSASPMTDDEFFGLIMKARDWSGYYKWVDPWLDSPTTWAVIPDVIDAPSQEQDALLNEWPFGEKGAPVWHMDEPISRLLRLIDEWPRVCIGSTGLYWEVLSAPWEERMDEVWEEISARHRRTPWIHMLRGMQLCDGHRWPFASIDSTDVAQNHSRPNRRLRKLHESREAAGEIQLLEGATKLSPQTGVRAERWDGLQCPPRWLGKPATAPQPQLLTFDIPASHHALKENS